MAVTTLALTIELPRLEESTSWSGFESWMVAMREELPVAALAEVLDQLQDELIDRVCGPRWLPVRGLPAPFACPGCGARHDFARKGKRTRPRRFDTAAGVVLLRLWHVGCRGCGKVFAPLLVMLGLTGKRRTDRLSIDLAALSTQMSFARAAAVAAHHGVPATAGRVHHALADVAALLVGDHGLGPACPADVVVLDGTGVRAGQRRLGTDCNVAIGLTGRDGPPQRRHAQVALLGVTVGQGWSALGEQLQGLPAPVLTVVDGELAVTRLAQELWPDRPIQRCWWHLGRGLRWALYADRAPHGWSRAKRAELGELLRTVARRGYDLDEALDAFDGFTRDIADAGHHAATELLDGAREQVFTCLRPDVRRRLRHLGGPEVGSGVLERIMRELNARTDIGGARWSIAGLRDLIEVQLARTTRHPAWQEAWRSTHQPNAIPFHLAKFNAG